MHAPLPIAIRHAAASDASELADLGASSFAAAFGHSVADADLARFLASTYSPDRQRAELADPRVAVLVAETTTAPSLAGYAMIRDHGAPAAVESPAPVELARLYTRPSLIGQGVGARLLGAAAEEARRRAFRSMWLGVWEHNPRAIAFYERHGFRDAGTHLFHLGTARQTDRLLVRSLDA